MATLTQCAPTPAPVDPRTLAMLKKVLEGISMANESCVTQTFSSDCELVLIANRIGVPSLPRELQPLTRDKMFLQVLQQHKALLVALQKESTQLNNHLGSLIADIRDLCDKIEKELLPQDRPQVTTPEFNFKDNEGKYSNYNVQVATHLGLRQLRKLVARSLSSDEVVEVCNDA